MRDLLILLFKHKYKICAVFFIVNIAVVIYTLSVKPVYRATSNLLLKYGREYVYRPELGGRGSLMYLNRDQSEPINSEIQVLHSRELIGNVIKSIGTDQIYPDIIAEASHDSTLFDTAKFKIGQIIAAIGSNETEPKLDNTLTSLFDTAKFKIGQIIAAIGSNETEPKLDNTPSLAMSSYDAALREFEKSLTIKRVNKSDVITISFEHTAPHLAAQSTNKLVELFQQKYLDIYGSTKSSAFLEDRVEAYRKKIETIQEEIKQYRNKNNVFSIEKKRESLLDQYIKLADAYESHTKDIDELQKRISELQSIALQDNQEIPLYLFAEKDTIIQRSNYRLLELRREKQNLQKKYKSEHPNVVRVNKEIELLEDNILKRIQDIIFDELRLKTKEVETEEKKLAIINNELQETNSGERVIQNLQHQLDTSQTNYQLYVAKLEEARIAEIMEAQKRANVKVLEFASVPVVPIRPRKKFNLAIGVLFGAFTAISLAIFVEYAGQRFSTKESAERLIEIPVLTTFPHRKMSNYNALHPQVQESMITLYHRIDILFPHLQEKVIQFISSRQEEGTTTIAQEFANACAKNLGKSVILIDQSPIMRTANGVQDVYPDLDFNLVTKDDTLKADPSIFTSTYETKMPSQSTSLSPIYTRTHALTELFDLSFKDNPLENLRQRFDLVLIDSPPAIASQVGMLISCRVDGVVLVVEADKTRWPVVRSLKSSIEQAGGNVLGMVLNKQRHYIPQFLYKRL